MNYRLRRFLETTVPMILLPGTLTVFLAAYVHIKVAYISVAIFSIIDVLLIRKED